MNKHGIPLKNTSVNMLKILDIAMSFGENILQVGDKKHRDKVLIHYHMYRNN